MKIAVLVDEQDRRLGKLQVPDACFVVRHKNVMFVRTQRAVKLHHSHRAFAVVFEQTDVYVREQLEAV